jgi:hypothetical protein
MNAPKKATAPDQPKLSPVRDRPPTANEIVREVLHQLGSQSISEIYATKVRSQRTRRYDLRAPRNPARVDILHTLLGIELKVANRRLLCPDLATARYLAVFARVGCEVVAIPYDITQISCIADELESAWHRMRLLAEHLTADRTMRIRATVLRKLSDETRTRIASAGGGERFPQFSQPARRGA